MGGRLPECEPLPCASAWYGRVAWRSRCALLIGVGATLFFFNLGARVLSTNDEARFPMLARDILSQGHWLLPRLDGYPPFEQAAPACLAHRAGRVAHRSGHAMDRMRAIRLRGPRRRRRDVRDRA